MNTEDNSITEGKRFYDIRFCAIIPCERPVRRYFINCEIQNNDQPGYPLPKRGTYYGCRMISSQYGTVFVHEDYGKLEKVFSIFICTSPAKKRSNCIRKYPFCEKKILGTYTEDKENYDLIETVFIYLSKDNEKCELSLLNMLNVLFSPKVSTAEKKRILHNEYGIAMTYEIESEVDNICNYSDGIYNRGISRGEILSYIRIIASKIRRGKSRETIMQDIFDNDEQQVYEYNDLYDIVEYNPEHSENELADMYMKKHDI